MFYDLNIPADGIDGQSRRELIAIAVQLGYDGIAANKIVTGLMTAQDACQLAPIDMGAVLLAAPGVAQGARFHQGLLKEPHPHRFKQMNRITVVVGDTNQASALNSANPVLQTYDLVAIQPTNQKVFARACTNLEVDIISLDLSTRLPFRFHRPMLDAAIRRGVFFEIQYAAALRDSGARRQLFANAQMLHSMTRGRHLILTSGALHAMELRGPYDVANLATILGFDFEGAKTAVSHNCRSVLSRGEARKSAHKAAIRVETIPSEPSPNLFRASIANQCSVSVSKLPSPSAPINPYPFRPSSQATGTDSGLISIQGVSQTCVSPRPPEPTQPALFVVPANWDSPSSRSANQKSGEADRSPVPVHILPNCAAVIRPLGRAGPIGGKRDPGGRPSPALPLGAQQTPRYSRSDASSAIGRQSGSRGKGAEGNSERQRSFLGGLSGSPPPRLGVGGATSAMESPVKGLMVDGHERRELSSGRGPCSMEGVGGGSSRVWEEDEFIPMDVDGEEWGVEGRTCREARRSRAGGGRAGGRERGRGRGRGGLNLNSTYGRSPKQKR